MGDSHSCSRYAPRHTFNTTSLIIYSVLSLILVVWGWVAYVKLVEKKSPYSNLALVGAVFGIFFSPASLVPIVLSLKIPDDSK